MPNIASVLKDEIARVARKELRAETEQIKKASAKYRSDIAALKRQIADLEKTVAKIGKGSVATKAVASEGDDTKIRFSAKSLASQRKRLGLSANEIGKLMGVSPQSIYNWEAGTTRPRAAQMPMIAALRKLSGRQAKEVLQARAS